ncbi:MAG: hypothetical protein J6L23_03165, partial [Clostridia bacterium]|nr:hypothetical protein [Clostridia bacterium]
GFVMPPTALLYLLRSRITLFRKFSLEPLSDFSNHFFDAGLQKRTKKELPKKLSGVPHQKNNYKIFERFQRKLSIESCLWSPKA